VQDPQSESQSNGDSEGEVTAKQTSVERHGYLSVQNGKMVDQHGIQPQLRGISFSWSIWEGEKYYNKQVVDWLVDDFKVDLIRLSMAIEPEGGYLQNPKKQEEKIISLIDQGIERGIYVIIDWHDHNANKNQIESEAFFQEMSKRYQHVPNVIYEIWNEPERQTWQEIKAYSEKIISAIRTYDKKNLIVVREKAEVALGLGLPLFITEWGVGEANGNGEFNLEKTDKWVHWMEQYKLSWVNWNITDKEETTALLKPGAPVNGGWDTSNLTPAGNYIRTVLLNFDVSKIKQENHH